MRARVSVHFKPRTLRTQEISAPSDWRRSVTDTCTDTELSRPPANISCYNRPYRRKVCVDTAGKDCVAGNACQSSVTVIISSDVGLKYQCQRMIWQIFRQCAMLKACDACADMGHLQRTVPIRKTFQ